MTTRTTPTPKGMLSSSSHQRSDRVTASTPARYVLPKVSAEGRALGRAWLMLGLAALLGSGLKVMGCVHCPLLR